MERREGMGAGFPVETSSGAGTQAEPPLRRQFRIVDRQVLPLRADYYDGFQARAEVLVEGVNQTGSGVGSSPREAYKEALKNALNGRRF